MGLTKQEIMMTAVEYMTSQATSIANEEMRQYEKDVPNAFITPEVSDKVKQRASSEALLRACNFACPTGDLSKEEVSEIVENWFLIQEEQRLHRLCKTAIKEEVAKVTNPEDENLSFSERFRKLAKEKRSTIDLLRGLQDHK